MESRKQRRALDTVICSSFLLNNLPDDLLQVCLSFVGPGQYRLVAGTCNRLRELYGGMFPKRTTWESAAGSDLCAALCMHETSDAAEPPSPLKDQILRALTNKAALTGKLAVLQWAIDDHSYAVGKWCFFHAGKCGQGNILEWGEANGMDWFSDDLCNAVMRNGHVGVLDWIYRNHPVELSLTYAARGGHIPVLNWMKQHELMGEVKPAMWYYAAERGHLHVLEWLLENCLARTQPILEGAAVGGRIDSLMWARDHDMLVDWNPKTCVFAACFGHLEVLKWLRQNGCPWDSRVIEHSQNRHPAVAQWARENGCPEPAPSQHHV